MKRSEQDRLLREILEDGDAANFRAASLARVCACWAAMRSASVLRTASASATSRNAACTTFS